MGRTKSASRFSPTIMQEYNFIEDEFERAIFFNYWLGYKTGGVEGYNIAEVDGSARHWPGVGEVYTKEAFLKVGKKMAKLAKRFLGTRTETKNGVVYELEPPLEQMPVITREQIDAEIEARRDIRGPMEKYHDELNGQGWEDYFIFFTYYDGWRTAGEIGFSPTVGPCGSVKHKGSYARLNHMKGHAFRSRGAILGRLAKEFVEQNLEPPEEDRPEFEDPEPPAAMIAHAAMLQHAAVLQDDDNHIDPDLVQPDLMVLDDDNGNDHSWHSDNEGEDNENDMEYPRNNTIGGYQWAYM